jgi:hypothetical protein
VLTSNTSTEAIFGIHLRVCPFSPAPYVEHRTQTRVPPCLLRSKLIYLLVSCRAGKEEARSDWHYPTAATPGGANDGSCVKPQQLAWHAPALEQDVPRPPADLILLKRLIDGSTAQSSWLHRINFCLSTGSMRSSREARGLSTRQRVLLYRLTTARFLGARSGRLELRQSLLLPGLTHQSFAFENARSLPTRGWGHARWFLTCPSRSLCESEESGRILPRYPWRFR